MYVCMNVCMCVCMYAVVRICSEDVSLGEHDLAKGSTIMVHMQGVHHNPNLWPEPLKYRPDRYVCTYVCMYVCMYVFLQRQVVRYCTLRYQ